jgi:uncharacterized secreted protein with C-terminal beta-propeller domain
MKPYKNTARRKLQVERLEVRRNMTLYVPDFFPNGLVDDFETVKVDSVDNRLSITRNDHVWPDLWWGQTEDSIDLPGIRAAMVPAVIDASFATNPLDSNYPVPLASPKILSVTAPKHGTARISEDKLSVIYTPERGYEGGDQFDYVVEGASAAKDSATVYVNIVQPLLAIDDWFLSKPSTPTLELDVLRNDQFNDSSFLNDELRRQFQIVSVTAPSQGGSARIADDRRSLIYSASSGFEGLEKLEYTFEDQYGYRDTAEVNIRVSQSTAASETLWPEQLQQQWLEEIIHRNSHQFGRGIGVWSHYPMPWVTMDRIASPLFATSSLSDSSSSRANNQVAGVDEGDLVESDGRFLFVFSRQSSVIAVPVTTDLAFRVGFQEFGGQDFRGHYSPTIESSSLVIIDSIDPKFPKVVSELSFSGRLVGQHVSGNRLMVLTESYGEGAKAIVTIVDIADRAAPKVVRSTSLDGSISQSRLIGDKLYVFTNSYVQVPMVKPHEFQVGDASFYETGRQYLARLGTDLFGESRIQVTNFDDTGAKIGQPINTLTMTETLEIVRGTGMATGIFTFDIDASQVGPFDIDIFASGYSPTLFVSSNAAYFFSTRWDLRDGVWGSTQVSSYAFAPEDGSVSYSATGNVVGSLLNSFSIAEYEGDLQVFSSVGLEGTRLSILRRDGSLLKEIGSLKNIAPGEQIYSARFAGDRAFAVTFRRVDPLFVFDLSNPTAPKIEGELKLPGYSQYLHIIDSTHLMGIGRDADENTGLFGSLQVSLFDVSDTKNPKLKSSYQFAGGRRTFSPLVESAFGLTDHHALGYSAESNILALPLTYYHDGSGARNEDGTVKDDNLAEVGVLEINTLTGIADLGGVQSPTPVYRTVQLGEYLYSIAADRVIVTGLRTPTVQHAELLLPQPKPIVPDESPTNTGDGGSNVTVTIKTTGTPEVTPNTSTSKRRWHHHENPCDVNGDGVIAPLDALHVINFLKSQGNVAIVEFESSLATGESAQSLATELVYQVDVNGDGEVSPLDILLVINRLRREAASQAEGEATVLTAIHTDAALAPASISDWSAPGIENEKRNQVLR